MAVKVPETLPFTATFFHPIHSIAHMFCRDCRASRGQRHRCVAIQLGTGPGAGAVLVAGAVLAAAAAGGGCPGSTRGRGPADSRDARSRYPGRSRWPHHRPGPRCGGACRSRPTAASPCAGSPRAPSEALDQCRHVGRNRLTIQLHRPRRVNFDKDVVVLEIIERSRPSLRNGRRRLVRARLGDLEGLVEHRSARPP